METRDRAQGPAACRATVGRAPFEPGGAAQRLLDPIGRGVPSAAVSYRTHTGCPVAWQRPDRYRVCYPVLFSGWLVATACRRTDDWLALGDCRSVPCTPIPRGTGPSPFAQARAGWAVCHRNLPFSGSSWWWLFWCWGAAAAFGRAGVRTAERYPPSARAIGAVAPQCPSHIVGSTLCLGAAQLRPPVCTRSL